MSDNRAKPEPTVRVSFGLAEVDAMVFVLAHAALEAGADDALELAEFKLRRARRRVLAELEPERPARAPRRPRNPGTAD